MVAAVAFGWWLRGRKDANAGPVIPQHDRTPDADYLRSALDWCLTMSGATRAIIWHIDNDEALPVSCAGGPRPPKQRGAGGPLGWVAIERVSLRIEPQPLWSDAAHVFAVPIETASHAFVLTLEVNDAVNLHPAQFDGLALYIAAVLGVQAQLGVLAQQHAHADELITTLRRLPEATDVDTFSRQLARAAISILQGSGASVSEWDNEIGTVLASEGGGPDPGVTFSGTDSETALAVRAGTVLVRNPGQLGKLPIVAPNEQLMGRPRAMVALPLKISGEPVGVLTVWAQHEISEHVLQDLQTLAPYAALQLRQAREFGVMRTRAEHDALTGLANRHAFQSFLAGETARYDRYQRPFSLVILDIDHFKSVNDRFGHEAGDYILQQVSHVIRASLRNVDFAARVGGEEFVVLAPETNLAEGVEIAERIRRRMEELTPNWRGQEIPVRVSAGVSGVPACVSDPAQLMRSADTALYQSKREGRNRVTAAPAADL